MVLILIGPAGSGTSTVARALGAGLGWPVLDSEDGAEVHRAAARAVDRREPLIVATPGLTAADRLALRGDLRLRFVYLKAPRQVLEGRLERRSPGDRPIDLHAQLLAFEDPGDSALTIDASQDVPAVVATITRELGV